jgi:hypothetical protein
MLLALTDEWQTASEFAEVAGIPVKGAGTVLLALRTGTTGDVRAPTPNKRKRPNLGRTPHMSTRTIAIAALVLVVIVIILVFVV